MQKKSFLSERLAKLQPSATIGLIGRISELRKEGINVISFGQGEPDFATPESIKQAGIDAIEKNLTRYTPAGGIPELREAIAQQETTASGVKWEKDSVVVTSGAKEALYLAFQAICNPGDEVIIPAPYWVSYIEQVHLASAVPVIIPTDETTGFKITAEQLAAHLTPKTRVLVLNSPSNPTGSVYNAEELAALAEVLRPTEVMVLSDEIYDRICYTPYARWLQVAPDMQSQTLIFNGFSKTYAMTGWRVGYVIGEKPIAGAMKSIQSHSTTHPASMAQYAALSVYSNMEELEKQLEERLAAFRERRDLIVDTLSKIPGVICPVPDGAFYVFPNVSGLLNKPLQNDSTCATSEELATYLLEQAHIGMVFGEAFGAPGYLRISYAQSKATIEEGMRRLTEAIG